jgi:hypothetical protein
MDLDRLNDDIAFSGNGINAKEDQGVIKLEPFKAKAEIFILREEGPLGIITTNDTLTINYGGEYTLEIESSEYKGYIVRLLDDQQDPMHTIEASQCEDRVEQEFGHGKISFDDEGHKLALYIKDEKIDLEVLLKVEGFNEKRKLKYSEVDEDKTFSIEMKSRNEMNIEEINKVEQEFLEGIRAGARSANMGIGQHAVAGAITRSFDIFRENDLQVIRNNVPVIELKVR